VAIRIKPFAWTKLKEWNPTFAGPPGREYGAMWIDAEAPDRLLVYGGFHYSPQPYTTSSDLWQLDLTANAWTRLQPVAEGPRLAGGSLVTVPGRVALYYGGMGKVGNDWQTPYSFWRLAYAPTEVTWEMQEVVGTSRHGDYQAAAVYDAPRNRVVFACGQNTVVGMHCDVSAFDLQTNTLSPVTPAVPAQGGPTGRNGFAWAHDVENQRLVIWSGEQGSSGWAPNAADDVWALELAPDPVRWVKLLPRSQDEFRPTPRRNGLFGLDPDGQRLVVWGGTADGATSLPGVFALTLDRGAEAWTEIAVAPLAPVRTSGMAVYDAPRRRLLFGFGNDSKVFSDLWALEL
jgi:hypothetical protein